MLRLLMFCGVAVKTHFGVPGCIDADVPVGLVEFCILIFDY